MTKFQALFVYWLREKCNCSWRALDAHFNNRYNEDGSNKKIEDKINFDTLTLGGNQLNGILLHEKSMKILNIFYE